MTVVNIALPSIARGLHFSAPSLSWVLNAYTLTFGGLLLLGGRAGDILGRRRVFIAGIALFTAASLAGGLATSAPHAARRARHAGRWRRDRLARRAGADHRQLLRGPGADPRAQHLHRRRHGRRFARPGARRRDHRVGVLALGPVHQRADRHRRGPDRAAVPARIAAPARAVRPRRRARPRPRAWPRWCTASSAPRRTDGATALALAAFAAAVVLLAAFLVNESRAAQPITPLRLFADRGRAGSYVTRLLLVAGMFGMFFFLTQFVQDVLGFSPLRAGISFLPMTGRAVRRVPAVPRGWWPVRRQAAHGGRAAAGGRRDGLAVPDLARLPATCPGSSARCCCSAAGWGWPSCRSPWPRWPASARRTPGPRPAW